MNRKLKNGIIIGTGTITFVFVLLWVIGLFDAKNPLDSNTDEVQLNIQFHHLNSSELITDESQFNTYFESQPELLDFLSTNYKTYDSNDSTSFFDTWKSFYKQDYVIQTEQEIKNIFPNFNKESKDLLESMKRLKFHFPDKKYPKQIIFTNTNFVILIQSTVFINATKHYYLS